MPDIDQIIHALQVGAVSSRRLTEQCLERIAADSRQSERVYLQLFADRAIKQSEALDQLKEQGIRLSPLMGLPISIKDLIDMEGCPTSAGSTFMAGVRRVTKNSTVVNRLQAAGLVILGKTNLVEFAYSGVGINPHFGTPLNPYNRSEELVPGGSSSGAAVSVSDGMALGAIGSDTGGSCRIPAALCGLVGFKPTASRIPLDGVFPLSSALDSIGPLAGSVDCCFLLDAVMSGEDPRLPDPADPSRIRAVVPEGYLMAKMDPHVRDSFNAALAVLDAVGMPIRRERLDVIDQVPGVSSKGGFAAAEAYHYHRRYIADYKECYDPRVLDRIAAGERISACDYQDIVTLRRVLQRGWEDDGRFEVMLLPATPITARPLAALAADEDFTAVNNLYLRNTSVANVLDCPSISIPCHKEGEAPVGLMMIGKMGQDRRLFGLAKAVEKVLNRTCR